MKDSFATFYPHLYYEAVIMAAKRLIKELDAYTRDPSSAITVLEPVSDEDLFHLRAVLVGPEETAYEGITCARRRQDKTFANDRLIP